MDSKKILLATMWLVLAGCATVEENNSAGQYASESEQDPWETYNRHVFNFNETVDKYFMKPVAQGYQAVTPEAVDEGVTNVFSNIGTIGTILNDVLQLKGKQALNDTGRLLINTTFGFFGVWDTASRLGLEKHKEDFGQTFAYWGVKPGPYFVLPFLGPSTVRDTVGLVPDHAVDPVANWPEVAERNSALGLEAVDTRADLLESEKSITGDRYTFIRDAYLQHREYLVKDGEVEDTFNDDY